MADIFISYANEDIDRVVPLAKALENQGWSVFWDRKIPPGRTWDDIIEEAIEAAKCIIVVWTKESVNSGWVRAEAQEGLDKKILVPVKFDDVKIPLRFRPVQAANFIGWEENTSNIGFRNLRDAITGILGSPSIKEDDRKRKEAEARFRAEEERKKKEAEAKLKADEERKRHEIKAEIKKDKPKSDKNATTQPKPPETRKTSNAVKYGAVAGVAVLLIVWIWLYISDSRNVKHRIQELSLDEPEGAETKVITNSIGMKFVLIPQGSFTMGSPTEEPGRGNDEKQHEVAITKPFYLQTTEVTQSQWKKVMGDNPSKFKDCGENCPVETVSWIDANNFIEKLNQVEGINKYRLPTEAEWEYACRSKTATPFFTGNCISIDQANYNGNYPGKNCAKGEYRKKTVKVGSFQPNAWGLYDMHGNVWEWVQDWYGEYPSDSVADPKGPPTGARRVVRGGGWNDYAFGCRSAIRLSNSPGNCNFILGFRLARSVSLGS
jgi:formylglycine-generating enzyme required for sulfatase activity